MDERPALRRPFIFAQRREPVPERPPARCRQRANIPLTIRNCHWKSVAVLPTFADNPIGADPGSGRSAPLFLARSRTHGIP